MDLIITNKRIEVRISDLEAEGMINRFLFAVPSKGGRFVWKDESKLKDSDFDRIEEYFINKRKKK